MIVSIESACDILISGSLVAMPTETVYGLAGLFSSKTAIQSIYCLKKRPLDNPLIVHIGKKSDIDPFVEYLPPHSQSLIDALWPGPLTILLPVKQHTSPWKSQLLAFRMPSHPTFLSILNTVGPIVAPSANISSKPSGTTEQAIEEDFGSSLPIVETETPPHFGIESTIISFIDNKWTIVRKGALSAEDISAKSGIKCIYCQSEKAAIPGNIYKHYAPQCKLYTQLVDTCEAIVGYSEREYENKLPFYSLGRVDDPLSIAKSLYETLRNLDRNGVKHAFVDTNLPITSHYAAILNRLQKACSAHDK